MTTPTTSTSSGTPTADRSDTTPAHAYHEYFGPAMLEPLGRHLVALASLCPGEHAADIACGTGIVTRLLADAVAPGGRVVGVDINPGMIAVARSLPGTSAPIEWREGDATALDLPSGAYDVLVCQQGLQYFADRAAGTAEMRRVLRSGGRAVVAVWRGLDAHPLFVALADAEEPHLAALGVDISRDELVAPFSLGDADELIDLFRRDGFTDVDVVDHTVEARFTDADRFVERMEFAYAAVVPEFRTDPAAFASYLDAVSRATETVVAEHRVGDHVVVPMHTHIAIARA